MEATESTVRNDQRWAFLANAYNLGDCSRTIELAKEMRATGAVVRIFHHGGYHVQQIREAGFDPVQLDPLVREEQHQALMAIDQHRARLSTSSPFSEQELVGMVESELEALRRFRPDGVLAGLNPSYMISTPHARLPMVTFIPTALCPAFFERGLATFPNAMETNFFSRYLVPQWLKRVAINRVMLGRLARRSFEVFNIVRTRYGLPPLFNYTEVVRGDLTLLPDLPELSGLPSANLPRGYRYCGPVFARMSGENVPSEVARVFARPGLKIYCAMGSSGAPELLRLVVAALRSVPHWNVVCATTTILDPRELGERSDNFVAVRYLPAHIVCQQADVAVIHGGQGTVQTAVWAGVPVVGVGFQWEQQANLDGLARAGAGLRIPLYSVSARRILQSVERVNTAGYRQAAAALRDLVRATDGCAEAIRQMRLFAEQREHEAAAPAGLGARVNQAGSGARALRSK